MQGGFEVKYLFVTYIGSPAIGDAIYGNTLVKIHDTLNTNTIRNSITKQCGFKVVILGWNELTEDEYNASLSSKNEEAL